MRQRQPETTRTVILDAAVEVMAEKGAAGLTLDAVVEQMAQTSTLSKGALLHHFPNKKVLLEGVVDHLGQAFLDQVQAEAAKDPDPYGRSARAYLSVVINEPVTGRDVSIGLAAVGACAIDRELGERWAGWVRKAKEDDPADAAGSDDAMILRLLADGLWMSDIFGVHQIPTEQRKALGSLMLAGSRLMEDKA